MPEIRRYKIPDALWRTYILLIFIVVLLLDLLLIFMLFVLINYGNSVPVIFFWPSRVIFSLHVSFSFCVCGL
jgi:hypothetical protein